MAEAHQNQTISITTGTIVKTLAIMIALAFLWAIRDIVIIVMFALIISAAINPLVDFFKKYKIPRIVSVLFIFILIVAIIAGIVTLLIPPIAEQISDLARQFSDYFAEDKVQIYQKLQDAAQSLQLQEGIRNFFSSIGETLSSTTGGVFSTVSSFFTGLFSVISIAVLTFYLSAQDKGIKKFFDFLVPSRHRDYVGDLINRIQSKLGAWLRTYLLMGCIVGVLIYIGLSLLGIKYALVLALLAGVLEFVPYVGPTLASIPSLFLSFSSGWIYAIMTLVLYVVVNQIEGHFIAPKLLGKTVGLNPVIVIVVLLIGAKLAGIVGMLLAVPLTITLMEFGRDVFEQNRFGSRSFARRSR